MMQKALWYVVNQTTHVRAARDDEDEIYYYVLKKDNSFGAKKITDTLITQFEAALGGRWPARVPTLEKLLALCQCMHIVHDPAEGHEVLECEGNPMKKECLACKGFKGVGICSHVLCVNHICMQFNVRWELRQIQSNQYKKAGNQGGNTKKPAPALQQAPTMEPDSSDEEEERLQRLGEQGK